VKRARHDEEEARGEAGEQAGPRGSDRDARRRQRRRERSRLDADRERIAMKSSKRSRTAAVASAYRALVGST
jgi:hypothetical protein